MKSVLFLWILRRIASVEAHAAVSRKPSREGIVIAKLIISRRRRTNETPIGLLGRAAKVAAMKRVREDILH